MSTNFDQAPSHQVHNSSDPLPTRAAQSNQGGGADYPPETPGQVDTASTTATAGKRSAFTEDRPLGAQPAPEGGVSRSGAEGLPEGKASLMDKVIGKTEKVVGKMQKNPERHEKGELRESGGKAAAAGTARAPHD